MAKNQDKQALTEADFMRLLLQHVAEAGTARGSGRLPSLGQGHCPLSLLPPSRTAKEKGAVFELALKDR